MNRTSAAHGLIAVLLAVALAASWLVHAELREAQSDYSAAIRDRSFPLLMRGLSLNGLFEVSDLETESLDHVSHDRVLIVVVSDTCAFCVEAMPRLKDLMSSIDWTGQGALIVSLRGTSLADEIAEAITQADGRPQQVTFKNRQAFQLKTGLRSTPRLIVADSELNILATTTRTDSDRLEAIRAAMRESGSGSLAAAPAPTVLSAGNRE